MGLLREIKKAASLVPPVQRLIKNHEDIAFRDLFARQGPDFDWQLGPRAPIACVEAARVQIRNKLYLFGGYKTLQNVSGEYAMLDLEKGQWTGRGTIPQPMAQTHQGTASDGSRYIFLISGQMGANCSPPTPTCFSFDTEKQTFSALPDLPEARYLPMTQYYNGRIHCLSGCGMDRNTTMLDHWSIGVDGGRATEDTWRVEPPLQSGRMHTSNVLYGSGLYVFGGQQGDVPPLDGSPDYTCNFDSPLDRLMDECFRFDLETAELRMLEPIPEKVSHSEHATVIAGTHAVLAGGVHDRMTMADPILSFDLEAETWRKIGHLPYPMKSKTAAYYDERLYIITGQRCISRTDLRPGDVLDTVWVSRELPQLLNS